MKTTDVVVGVDGSPPSWEALRWAAAEAGHRRAALRVLAAYRAPWPAEEIAAVGELGSTALARTEDIVASMVAHAREAEPGIRVSGLAVCGAPVPALHAAASNAALLVVGSRGHGGFTSLLLGATSLQLATHASVPVVVVRGDAGAGTEPVVVGTDESPGAEVAVGLAFEEAALRGCWLIVMYAYQPPLPVWSGEGPTWTYNPRQRRLAEHARLDQSIAGWRDKYPKVPVETVVTPDDPAQALVAGSRGAQLVVVGTRGHGGLAGLLLGSVGQKLLHHAHCPVLIARTTGG